MVKFLIVTRGRTGSTAVIDELGKMECFCTTQELFRPGPYTEKILNNHYRLIPPYDRWKEKSGWLKSKFPNSWMVRHYLDQAEILAQQQGSKVFGFKVLSHHFEERKYLKKYLKNKNYKVVYLRRNSVRQVLSGMIANLRGIWNKKEEVSDDKKYYIEIDKFKWHVNFERQSVKNDCDWLSSEKFEFLDVKYEDFCYDREKFYGNIFNFLNLPIVLPPFSDYVKVIKNLDMVIENYDEICAAAIELGEAI